MENGPIPVTVANTMIQEYQAYMTAHAVDMAKQTHSVSFEKVKLMEWLNKVMPDADELRIFFGAYGKDQENAGRTTVILWPYLAGEPTTTVVDDGKDAPPPPPTGTPPYNQGTLNP